MLLKKVFQGSGIIIQVSGAENDIFSSENWWKSDRGISSTFQKRLNFRFISFGVQNLNWLTIIKC